MKTKMLTGTYILQSNRARFNQYEVDPTCQMCHKVPETRTHFLLHCPALEEARRQHIDKIAIHIPEAIRQACMSDDDQMEKIILNCPKTITVGMTTHSLDQYQIETTTRGLCYSLHLRRAALLDYRP